jgi:hypothetical protein
MQVLRIIKYVIIMGIIFSGCYYDNEIDLYGNVECETADMSFANDILPILEKDCYQCHSIAANFGNITLEGFDNLSKHVNSGRLVGAISHDGGYSPMPKGGAKLLDCEIAKIESWIQSGALNN